MAVLSVMAIPGNPDDLVARMEAAVDPVARDKAREYGGISSTIVRTDDGVKVFNLWETEEGRHRMAEDPEIQASIRAAGLPEPNFKGYEVLAINWGADVAKALVRRVVSEIWTQGKLGVIDEVISPDYVGFSPTDGEVRGTAGFRQLVERYHAAFTDVEMRIEHIVGEGDWAGVHWTATGTHTAELMGIAPTGREVTVTGFEFSRAAGGKLVEGHGLFDALGMLQQLGAVPAGAPASVQT